MANFLAFVDDAGHIAVKDKRAWKAVLQKHLGKDVVISIVKRSRQGSQSMRYYRGVVIPAIAEASGVPDPDDYESVHDAMAWKYLRIADSIFGTPRRRSTAKDDLTSEEMTDYISKVITFAETSIPGCRVPRPDEQDLEDVYDPGWS